MWLSQALLLATLSGCVLLWRRSLDHRTTWQSTISLALMSLLLFSPAQHQNLFWGFQICFYISGACLLASILITSSSTITCAQALATAAVLSTIATFSILPGLLTWPLTALAVRLRFGPITRTTASPWALWALCCAAIVGLYFFRYEAPGRSPSLLAALQHPLALLTGMVCVGNPFGVGSQPVRSAIVAGALATGALGWLMFSVWRRRVDTELVARAAPWIVMSSFGFLSAAAIAAGRVGYGYVALLESRYAALTVWVLVGLVMLAAVLGERAAIPRASRGSSVLCAALAGLYALSLPHHLARIQQAHHERLQSQAVYSFADVATSGWPMVPSWADWAATKQKLRHVEKAGWRRDRAAAPTWVDTDELRASCGFGSVEHVTAVGPRVMAGGWGFLPMANRPADAVLVTVGPSRRIAVLQPPLIGRGDIGERFHSDAALVSGWLIDTRAVPADEPLEFWALDVKAWRAYRLCQATVHPPPVE